MALLDNFLRPILISRGVDLPLILIIAGVIGGLIAFGVIGLFIGPVILAVTYSSLGVWIADKPATEAKGISMRIAIREVTDRIGVLALLSGCVVNAPPVAENTSDGLVRVQSKQVDTVYAKPGVSLARYKRVMLDSVELAFKLDWEKRHPEVSESDIARIRSQGSAVFYEIFSSALTLNNGYPLTTQPGRRRAARDRIDHRAGCRRHAGQRPARSACTWSRPAT